MKRPTAATHGRFLLVALFGGGFLWHAPAARALPIGYATCPANTTVYVPVNIGTNEYERRTFAPSYYADLGEYSWSTYFNRNVGVVFPRMKDFHVENLFDYLDMTAGGVATRYTGDYGDGYTASGSSVTGRAVFKWHSDWSVALQSKPRIDEVAIWCNAGNAAIVNDAIAANTRVEGVLIGTGDVLYFGVPQLKDTYLDISLDVLAASPTTSNFDMEISFSNPFPESLTADVHATRSNSSGTLATAGENTRLSAPSANRTVFIRVRSASGKGHFVLHASAVKKATLDGDSMRVCSEDVFGVSHPNWANFVKTLQLVSARVAQMTNGGRIPISWWRSTIPDCGNDVFCWNSTGCDVVMTPDDIPGQAFCGFQAWGGRFRIPDIDCSNYSNPVGLSFVLAHEWGHAQLGIPTDEYEVIGGWNDGDVGAFCGHSIMNGPDQSHTLCTGLGHCEDPAYSSMSGRYYAAPVGYDCSDSGSMWQRVSNSGLVLPSAIPGSATMPDQWDSLRANDYWKNDIIVLP